VVGFDRQAEAVQHDAIICLPIPFTAGMTLMDTTDGLFMNLAYGWAFFNPVRKVYYNLAITGLSVAICFFHRGRDPRHIPDGDPRPRPFRVSRSRGLGAARGARE